MSSRLVVGLLLLAADSARAADPPRGPDTITGLVNRLRDEDPTVRLRAARDLGNLGAAAREAVPQLMKALRDPAAGVRDQAGKALSQIGTPAVPELIAVLQDRAAGVRAAAARALGRIGPDAREAVPALTAVLQDGSESVRAAAAFALGEMGPEARPAAADLVRALRDPQQSVRELAAAALNGVGPGAIAPLKDALQHDRAEVRLAALRALAGMGSQAGETLPLLRDALKDKDARLRALAAVALGTLGADAKDAVPDLLDAVQDKNLEAQTQAVNALVNLMCSRIPGLLAKVREADAKGKRAAPLILAQFGPRAPDRVAGLVDQLADKDPNVRREAVLALAGFVTESRPAVTAVTRALRDENTNVRTAAALVLARLERQVVDSLDRTEEGAGLLLPAPTLAFPRPAHAHTPSVGGGGRGMIPRGYRSGPHPPHRSPHVQFGRAAIDAPKLAADMFQHAQQALRAQTWAGPMQEPPPASLLHQAALVQQQAARQLLKGQRDLLQHQRVQQLLDIKRVADEYDMLNTVARKLLNETPEALRGKLRDDAPAVRWLATQVIGRRHVHLEQDLIDCLRDRFPDIREAARQALVRLGRGTDFGPGPGYTRSQRERSIAKWQNWLVLQDASPGREGNPHLRSVVKKPYGLDPRSAIKLVLEAETTTLETEDARVASLSAELVRAKGEQQQEVLERLRDSKGVLHTEALALAIPQLSEKVQARARDALVERMARMTARTLRDKFEDEDAEVRRAAALACARKGAKEHVPDLLRLLDDAEWPVVQAARAALTELTGEDFGPEATATLPEHARSVAAWRKWWQEQEARK